VQKWWNYLFYKPNSQEIYWGKIIPSVIVVIGFFLIVIFNNKRLDKLKNERIQFARYAIGTTTGQHNNIKGNLVVDYYFMFLDKKITNSEGTGKWFFGKPNTHGGRYYVLFASNNPYNSEMLFENPVPDSFNNAPDSGWNYMPGYENLK
jgi:hypothetical protein